MSEDAFYINCMCSCDSKITFTKIEDGLVEVGIEETGLAYQSLRIRIKRAWNVLRGKPLKVSDFVIIEENVAEELKNWL